MVGAVRPVGAGSVTPRVKLYVGLVVAGVALASAGALAGTPVGDLGTILLWAAAAIASQLMIFPTLTGTGQISLSTCAHLAMILVLSPAEFVPALLLGRVAVALFDRKPWYRSLFNGAQVTGAVLAGSWVYQAFGAATDFQPSAEGIFRIGPAFVAAALTYYVLNMAAVCTVISLSGGGTALSVWKQNYGYRSELVGTAALVLLAPLAALVYLGFQGPGLVLFLAPMLFIRDATARYASLKRTQEQLVQSERQAARTELAADVGQDINTYLCIAQAQLQLVLLRKADLSHEELERRLGLALDHIQHMNVLSRGLIDFTRQKNEVVPTDLSELIQDAVAFLVPQKRFRDVSIQLDLDPRARVLPLDPHQIRHALTNLLIHASDSMEAAGSPRREIVVWTRASADHEGVEIGIRDCGPEIDAGQRSRAFEAAYVAHDDTSGHALFIAGSIVRGHQGVIVTESPAGGGNVTRIALPHSKVTASPPRSTPTPEPARRGSARLWKLAPSRAGRPA